MCVLENRLLVITLKKMTIVKIMVLWTRWSSDRCSPVVQACSDPINTYRLYGLLLTIGYYNIILYRYFTSAWNSRRTYTITSRVTRHVENTWKVVLFFVFLWRLHAIWAARSFFQTLLYIKYDRIAGNTIHDFTHLYNTYTVL